VKEIPRPENKRMRKNYYPGKKKHTVKTQYMANSDGTILHRTGHERGRIHDCEIFKNKHPTTPLQVENILVHPRRAVTLFYIDYMINTTSNIQHCTFIKQYEII
jgi:hypothetical protein